MSWDNEKFTLWFVKSPEHYDAPFPQEKEQWRIPYEGNLYKLDASVDYRVFRDRYIMHIDLKSEMGIMSTQSYSSARRPRPVFGDAFIIVPFISEDDINILAYGLVFKYLTSFDTVQIPDPRGGEGMVRAMVADGTSCFLSRHRVSQSSLHFHLHNYVSGESKGKMSLDVVVFNHSSYHMKIIRVFSPDRSVSKAALGHISSSLSTDADILRPVSEISQEQWVDAALKFVCRKSGDDIDTSMYITIGGPEKVNTE